MATITYNDLGASYTLPLGRDRKIEREGGDICLLRAVALDCPLTVRILLREDGSIDLWECAWSADDNTYWRLADRRDAERAITPEQRATLERMFLHLQDLPCRLDSALDALTTRLMRGDSSLDDICRRHGAPVPYLREGRK